MFTLYYHVLFILVSGVLICKLCTADGGGGWGYKTDKNFKGPNKWKYLPESSCDGLKQSPVNIVTDKVQYWSGLLPITFNEKLTSSTEMPLKKSEMSLKLSFTNRWILKFGNKGCFAPIGIHWHWGSVDIQGSEHTINGKIFPIEGHLIFYNCDIYNSTKSALSSTSNLVVIGVFYEIGKNNTAIEKIIPKFNDVEKGNTVYIDEISPIEFMPKDLNKYYRYDGSLTTPPCSERVTWTLMKTSLTIGKSQLDKFRSLTFSSPESGHMVDNFRPVMSLTDTRALHKRIVFSSFNGYTKIFVNSILLHLSVFVFIWAINV